MASKEKAEEYFEKSGTLESLSHIKGVMLSRMYIDLMEKGNKNAAEYCEFEKRKDEFLTKKMVGFMSEFFEQEFTDEEMDELIAIHSSPVFKRLNDTLPNLMTGMLNYITEHEKEIEEKINSIRAQVKEEYAALAGAAGETFH